MMDSQELNHLKELLEIKIRFAKPIDPALKDLDPFDDRLEELEERGEAAIVTRDHVSSILTRFLNDELTAQEIEHWGFWLYNQDGVMVEPGHEKMLNSILSLLDWGETTREEAKIMIEGLKTGNYIPPVERK